MAEFWFISISAIYAVIVFTLSKWMRACDYIYVHWVWLVANSIVAGGYLSVLTRGAFYPVQVVETPNVLYASAFMFLFLLFAPWRLGTRYFLNRERK